MNAGFSPARSYAVTPEVFGKFLEWLSADRELAARQYLEIRSRLVRSFVRRGCAHAEELSDRTLDRVAVIVHSEPGKYPNPLALSCGVAKKIWLEYLREIVPDALETDNIPAQARGGPGEAECEFKCLDSCLERLSSHERDLITQYHQFNGRHKIEARKRLAQEQGGINKLRLMAFRIRAKLHQCINQCLRQSAAN